MAKINFNNLKEYFKIAFKTIATRRVRSWLTTIGIVIGVFLIVSLLSLSQGLKNGVLQQLNMMGKDLITIMPGDITDVTSMISGLKLTEDDLNIIKKTEGVKTLVAMDYTSVMVRYNDQKKTAMVYGADWRADLDIFKNDMGWSIAEGRWPIPGKAEAVIGGIIAKDIFPGIMKFIIFLKDSLSIINSLLLYPRLLSTCG